MRLVEAIRAPMEEEETEEEEGMVVVAVIDF